MFKRYSIWKVYIIFLVSCLFLNACLNEPARDKLPNILFAIADDQGYPHSSAYGCQFVKTPGFDRVADEGVLFRNTYCAAPQCSPNRASILTGRYLWQNNEAGTHASLFPAHLKVFTDYLIDAGYEMGSTGKTWGPGVIDKTNRIINSDLIGKYYNTDNQSEFWKQFENFLGDRKPGKPFFFWYGSYDPHRPYKEGSGLESGKSLESVEVPPYLPDCELVRSDFLDYGLRIERFDSNLVKMIDMLEEKGELDNTLIIVTSDNGMPFPRAKGNAYIEGVHVPMAICWRNKIPAGCEVNDLISHIDLAPTILEVADLEAYPEIEGKSFLDLLFGADNKGRKPFRESLFYGRERATSARPNNLGYPTRTILTTQYELVWNMKPDRMPAGDSLHESGAVVITKEMIRLREKDEKSKKLYHDAFGLRPEFELHDMENDPYGLVNLAEEPEYREIFNSLLEKLKHQLIENDDPRMKGKGDIWESYPRFMGIRDFNGNHPAYRGVYNEYYVMKGQRIPEYLLDTEDYKIFYEKTGTSKEEYMNKLIQKGVVFY